MHEVLTGSGNEYGLSGRVRLLDILQTALYRPGNGEPPEDIHRFEEDLTRYLIPDTYSPTERRSSLSSPTIREARARNVARMMPALFTDLYLEGVITSSNYERALEELMQETQDSVLEANIIVLLHGDDATVSVSAPPSSQMVLFAQGYVA